MNPSAIIPGSPEHIARLHAGVTYRNRHKANNLCHCRNLVSFFRMDRLIGFLDRLILLHTTNVNDPYFIAGRERT